MKNIILALVLAMISSIVTAQTDLSQLNQNDKKEYLERVSKEMLKEMAPDYVDECKIGEISDPVEFTEKTGKDMGVDEEDVIKYIGKKYYSIDYVTKYIYWDTEMIGHITVHIWEHNGEPLSIYYNIGEGMRFHFVNISYKDFINKYPPKAYQLSK